MNKRTVERKRKEGDWRVHKDNHLKKRREMKWKGGRKRMRIQKEGIKILFLFLRKLSDRTGELKQ